MLLLPTLALSLFQPAPTTPPVKVLTVRQAFTPPLPRAVWPGFGALDLQGKSNVHVDWSGDHPRLVRKPSPIDL